MTNVELIEALCDTIARQAETIKQLTNELEQFRAISEEEEKVVWIPYRILERFAPCYQF